MYIFNLLFLIIPNILFSQWNEVESPKSVNYLNNINSGSDFLIGSDFDLYFSFDEGQNWEKRINGLPTNRDAIKQIEVENELIVISTTSSFKVKRQYVYYSIDKGKNWINLIEKLDTNLFVTDFKIRNNNIYILTAIPRKIFKSTDFGISWDSTISFVGTDISPFYFNVENDTIVTAKRGAIGSGGSSSGGVQVSTDHGKSWVNRSDGLGVDDIHCIKVINKNIYVGGNNGFYYSNDFGLTWKSPGMMVIGAYVNDIEVINDTVYLATEKGLYRAIDLFKGWEEIPFFKQKRVWQIHFGLEKLYLRALDQNYTYSYCYYSINNDFTDYIRVDFLSNSNLRDLVVNYPSIYVSSKNINVIKNFDSKFETFYESDSTLDLSCLTVYENNIVCTYYPTSLFAVNKTIIYSTDNGENWNKTELSFEDTDLKISDLFLLNSDTLFIVTNIGTFLSSRFNSEIDLLNSIIADINDNFKNVTSIFRKEDKIYFYGKGTIIESDTNLRNWKDYSINLNKNSIVYDYSKDNQNLFTITHGGGIVDPNSLNFLHSSNSGESWVSLKNKFNNYPDFWPKHVLNIEDFVFLSSQSGIFLSKDNGESWEEINEGIDSQSKINGGRFYLYGDKIIFLSNKAIYYRDLEDLGISLSVENTEKRNYLYTFPPFPQPTKNEVKINTYWDSALPFTTEDIEIYNLSGVKINTTDKLRIIKETNYNGHIIWDTSNEEAGIYIVYIKHGTESRTRKVMVEK